MEIATFDYKVHIVVEEIESSFHSPRHADIHFMTMHYYDQHYSVTVWYTKEGL